jgi:cbb3-type cytochrome oxidase subunit 3
MMHDYSWGFGMSWGIWIIPLVVILIIVFLLRGKRKK